MSDAAREYPILVPRPYLSKIRPGDPNDPLLLQVLPTDDELKRAERFTPDPLGEFNAPHGSIVLWKYKNRILMLTTSHCGVHCRFCFRRHFPHPSTSGSISDLSSGLAKISQEESISEVILSGGDPLCRSDDELAELAGQLAKIDHVRRLRIHTRMPIMIPQRINDSLLTWLTATRLTPLMVIHVNHPREIDPQVTGAFRRLLDSGVPLLSQTVLLRGVNDRLEVLAELCESLIDFGVIPYYLHQLDRVAGATHFEVPVSKGIELVKQLRTLLPGYAVPRYARETIGAKNKELLA